MLTEIKIDKFTAFERIDVKLSRGINVFIGANGTGKTHIMKLLYGAMQMADNAATKTMDQILHGLFLPDSLGRLVKRSTGRGKGGFTVYRSDSDGVERSLRYELTTLGKSQTVNSRVWSRDQRYDLVYIPVKDMLANSPGFKSLYEKRDLYFESIYADIISMALLPPTKGQPSREKSKLLDMIQKLINGKVEKKEEKFYLRDNHGNLEFTLLAEGYRKLGLLYTLIQNESISSGSILFWDEPEANLNPRLTSEVVKLLLEIQRMGTQVFIATHDYVLLKELELAKDANQDQVTYHALYDEEGEVYCQTTGSIREINHNAINDTYDSLMVRVIGNEWED
jgi:ABC-type ATPase involved in cell division